jgi:hypothetical protein
LQARQSYNQVWLSRTCCFKSADESLKSHPKHIRIRVL